MKDSRLMRVPKEFDITIRDIAKTRNISLTDALRKSTTILSNADALDRFIFGIPRKKK